MIVVEYGICHGPKIAMISSCYRFSRNLQWKEIWPDEILKAAEGKPVITQCEREGLYKKEPVYSFIITENSTLRFEINSTELEKERLKFPGTMRTNSTI